MFSILRQRNFALLWIGQVISMAGDWVLYASLAFYVYTLTGSVLLSGSLMIASTVPGIFLGNVAGVFVDRWDRRRTMIVADLGRAAVLLSLLLVRSAGDIWLVYLAAAADAALSQFFGPAKNALVPRIVTTEELVPANSANSVGERIGMLVGPAMGGFLLAKLGLQSVVIFDVLSFLLSAGTIALMALPAGVTRAAVSGPQPGSAPVSAAPAVSAAGKVWRELLDGLRLIPGNPVVKALFLLWTITSIGEGLLMVLMIPWVSDVLHGTSVTFGWMMTVQALGSIAGGILVGSAGKARQGVPALWRLVLLGALGWGVVDAAIFNSTSIPLALVLFAAVGVPIAAMGVSRTALIQSEVPDEYRGRLFGAFGAAGGITVLAGMAASATLGDRVGIVRMLNLACAVIVVGVAVAWAVFRPDRGRHASPGTRVEPRL